VDVALKSWAKEAVAQSLHVVWSANYHSMFPSERVVTDFSWNCRRV